MACHIIISLLSIESKCERRMDWVNCIHNSTTWKILDDQVCVATMVNKWIEILTKNKHVSAIALDIIEQRTSGI